MYRDRGSPLPAVLDYGLGQVKRPSFGKERIEVLLQRLQLVVGESLDIVRRLNEEARSA